MKYRLGTRKSALAVKQSELIQKLLQKKGCETELVLIESEGDKNLTTPLYEIEVSEPGLFTKQLERALLERKVDLAVHSLKDLPTQQPNELTVGAITTRESTHDCLIQLECSFDASQFLGLKEQAVVGTSSLRRQAQIKSVRPDIKVVPIRGNVPRRLEWVKEKKVDAILLAEAGLNRLEISLDGFRKQVLPVERFVPAPGQGALAIEIRKDCPAQLLEALNQINDPQAQRATLVERTILRELEGGCTLPLGVYCRKEGKGLKLNAFLGVLDKTGTEVSWKAFHHFDNFNAVEQTLISETVTYFRSQSDALP